MPEASLRKVLRLAHLWLGLILCIPLVLIGLTGTILTFDRAFEAHPVLAAGEAHGATEIVAAAAKAAPAGQVPSFFIPPAEPGAAATVRFSQPGKGGPARGAMISVDPVSLAVLDTAGPGGFLRQVHMLHANLLIGTREGRSVVGWLGVVMLAMGISGLVIWWPRPGRWRAAFAVARTARGVRLHRELHGAVGIWGLLVFITVSFSGVWLAFPDTMAAMAGAEAAAPPPKVQHTEGAQGHAQGGIDIDRAIALAQAGLAEGVVRNVGLPMRPDQPFRINMAHKGDADGAPAVTVFVDPWAARVIESRDPSTLAAPLRFAAWQRALHTGMGLGPVWHVLVGLTGFLPLLFAVTGVSMWLMKRRARQRMAVRGVVMAEAAE